MEPPDKPAELNTAELMAMEQVMATYEAALQRYATRLLNNGEAAQDVVQTAFIRLDAGPQAPHHDGDKYIDRKAVAEQVS